MDAWPLFRLTLIEKTAFVLNTYDIGIETLYVAMHCACWICSSGYLPYCYK